MDLSVFAHSKQITSKSRKHLCSINIVDIKAHNVNKFRGSLKVVNSGMDPICQS